VAKDGKFGTFGGVFTPSILTILGVIMYLRLPWVVGSAGLYVALGIIAVSHVISISTGLSISSIATDKKVGAGGPYYIVSRSLGLPIGGTLGLALFTGLAFSVSLYVIGFSESFLSYVHIARTPSAIRICGSVTLVLITAVTLISTEFAIKTQYLILTAIALSLASIFLGSWSPPPVGPHLGAPTEGPSVALLFGIFFPAVTGFTAGVNMSGDLRNPKKSIPVGTMTSIAAGLAVYVGLAIFIAYRVPAKALVEDQDVLIHVAWIPVLVVAGIWGATLSSAIGSIMGAPRILQALGNDGITPRWFGRGYGKTNEPRNALVLAVAIAEGGILIAELDAIARIVSMVFLTTYGFLNLSAAIESWASPDFRPSFRIPKLVSIVGAVTAVLVMIQLDILAMSGATLLMAGLFFYLQRKRLELEAGDAWAGIWSSLIRAGLARISHESEQKRNWRPIILLFRSPDSPARGALRDIARALVSENGIVTDFELYDPDSPPSPEPATGTSDVNDARLGVFDKKLPCKDRYEAVENVCRYHGFAALEPNTLLLPWSAHRHDPERFSGLLDRASEQDYNILLFDPAPEQAPKRRIDVWWSVDAGNLGLSIALLRFITRESSWERAALRLFLLSPDSSANDHLRSAARRLLTDARFDATIRVVNDSLQEKTFEQWVLEESRDADLTLVGLPNEPGLVTPEYQSRVDHLVETLRGVLLFRASSIFEESLHLAREASVSFLPPVGEEGRAELPELVLPKTPDLARKVGELAEAHQHLATRFHEDCVQRVHARHVELVRRIIAAMERYFDALAKTAEGAPTRRHRSAQQRAQSAMLDDCREALEAFSSKHLEEQRGIMAERIEAFLGDDRAVDRRREPEALVVHRKREDFEPRANDSDYVRGFKFRRRLAARFRRGSEVTYRVPISELQDFYFQSAVRDGLSAAVRQLETDTHQLVITLGKVLNSIQAQPGGESEAFLAAVEEQRRQVVGRLSGLVQRAKEHANGLQWSLLVTAREIAANLAADLDRLDVRRLIQKERRLPRDAAALGAELRDAPARWQERQARLAELAELALKLSSFQHRLAGVVSREEEAMVLEVEGGVLGRCRELISELASYLEQLAAAPAGTVPRLDAQLDIGTTFDPRPVVDALLREGGELALELPETLSALSDESVQALEEGRFDSLEMLELPVRRLVQFLVESKFVSALQEELAKIPKAEQRAAGVAQDVLRLIGFQIGEAEAAEEAERDALRDQLAPVVENGLERVRAEVRRLSELIPEVGAAFGEQLELVLDGTNAYDLGATSQNLEQHIRRHQGRVAVSGARGLIRRGVTAARRALVNLTYRKSEGVLLARRLEAATHPDGALVDRIASLVDANTPRPEVLEALPFYYRQLFFGQSALSDAFWVGRNAELEQVARAVASFRRGAEGALIIAGPRASGKTALAQRSVGELFAGREVLRVQPRPGGSVQLAHFDAAVAKARDTTGTSDAVIRALPDGSAVVIDDLELWWERSREGMAVVDRILELVERHGGRVLFILCVGRQALNLLDRLCALSDRALAVVHCGPMPAEALKTIVTLRHASTGVKFSLGERSEDDLGALRLARLFSGYFDYSGGVVGAALRGWIAHVDKVGEDALVVRAPHPERWELVDELRREWVALLLQLVLHKQMSSARLERVTGLDRQVLARELDTLRRIGLLVESRKRVVEINPFVFHIVSSRFLSQGLLA
jgi:amino acid transporter